MNYWLTTHWPPLEGVVNDPVRVYLPDDRKKAGEDLEVNDLIFVYQSQSGRDIIVKDIKGNKIKIKSLNGAMQVVSLVRATTPIIQDNTIKETQYADGTKIRWNWYAETEHVSSNGFIPLKDVTRILGYSPNYNLRAFGDRKSGLKKLTKKQFDELLKVFNGNSSKLAIKSKTNLNGIQGLGGESDEHKNLKNMVASDPSKYLKEEGLKTFKVEFPFPSGDRADIVLQDQFGRFIGVEIEITQDENNFIGVLQAIKYRYMLAFMFKIGYENTRAFLVAKKISKDLKSLCKRYDVECFEIK